MTQSAPIPRPELEADCDRCFGLCCTALSFSRPDGFGHDKPAGLPCHFLGSNYSCAIHPRRETLGYEGCIDFTCLGAGQRASAQFATQNWRTEPATRRELYARFAQLLQIQEMRAAIVQAGKMEMGEDVEQERVKVLEELEQAADGSVRISNQDVETALKRAMDVLKAIAL